MNAVNVNNNTIDSVFQDYLYEGENKDFDSKIFIPVTNGNIIIEGKNYTNLDTANGIDINEEIKRFVINELQLKIVK